MNGDFDRALDSAASGLVHDLNNVFTTILEAAELLENDPKWIGLAQVLERNVARARRILEHFRASERGEPGHVELNEVAASAVQFASDLPRTAQVEFRRSIEPGIELRGSWTGWERALFNLLTNASQSLDPEGGTVEIRARRIGADVEIAVTDDGRGFSEEALPHVFEPGFSTKPEHLGLGLHIARSVVVENGGSITAQNRLGDRGSEVRIVVPAIEAPPAGLETLTR